MANIEHHSLYIDLLIKCVAGTIYGDPGISPSRPSLISKVKGFLRSVGKKAEYDPVVRENGADWPTIAHTMIGVKRLSSLRDCVETVIKDNVPGDFIET